MVRKFGWCLLALSMACANPYASAQEGHGEAAFASGNRWFDNNGAAFLGGGIGVGLVIIGGAKGIGNIGSKAAEAMARQPEAAGSINGVALILAAMIEGATLFAVVVCLLTVMR